MTLQNTGAWVYKCLFTARFSPMDVCFDVLSDELTYQVGGVAVDQSSHKLETLKKAISLHRAAIEGKKIRLQEALASSDHALAKKFSACEHPDA